MATHGEIRWPSVGTFDGRLRGDSHGRRHTDPHVSLSTHTARAVRLEDTAPQYLQCTNSSGFRVRRP